MKVQALEREHRLLRKFLFDTVDVVSNTLQHLDDSRSDDRERLQELLDQAQHLITSTLSGLREEVEETNNRQTETPGTEVGQDGCILHKPVVETDISTQRQILPIELLRIIIKHTSPQDLISCCLVNKSWSFVSREELWKYPEVSMAALSNHQSRKWTLCYGAYLSKLFEARTNRIGWDASRFVNRVALNFHRLPVGRCQLEHLAELFPGLSTLSLYEMPRFGDLAVLMRQRWRYLRSLKLINMPTPFGGRGFWTVGEEYDRSQARLFFSQLQEISCRCFHPVNASVEELFLGSAHPDLRIVRFPAGLPESSLMRYLSRCSSALRAICLDQIPLTDSAWQVFAETCTGLEALRMWDCNVESTVGIWRFIELRGSKLKCFVLLNCLDVDRSLLQHITRQCPALEFFYVGGSWQTVDQVHPDVDSIVDFIRGPVGPKLIHLDLFWWNPLKSFDRFKKVIEAVAECCPRMQLIRVPSTVAYGDDTKTAALELPDELSDKLRKGCKKVKVLADASHGFQVTVRYDESAVAFSTKIGSYWDLHFAL